VIDINTAVFCSIYASVFVSGSRPMTFFVPRHCHVTSMTIIQALLRVMTHEWIDVFN